jgi:hypothetical protein
VAAPENSSLCVVASYETVDRHGHDVLVVVAKLTYAISAKGEVRLAQPPAPVRDMPELTGPAPFDASGPKGPEAWSSERYPSDVVDEKPGTDVLFVGTAHPSKPGATFVDVVVRVARPGAILQKIVRVHGPRVWHMNALGRITPGPAAALAPTPIVYERSFGGRDESDPEAPLVDEHNPVGMGLARNPSTLVGMPAPVIEDPESGAATGFGPIRADWEPRLSRAGTYDAAWARTRAPVRPLDYDPRHASCAPDDLWSEQPLIGNEPIDVVGATPEGAWRFCLPRYQPVFELHAQRVPTHLDTLLVDGDARRAELTWRVALRLPRKSERLGPVRISSDFDDDFYRIAGETLVELVRSGVPTTSMRSASRSSQ